MHARVVLAAVLLLAALVVGIWDIAAVARGKPFETVSNLMFEWSSQHPVLPFVLGLLTGHLLWPVNAIQTP